MQDEDFSADLLPDERSLLAAKPSTLSEQERIARRRLQNRLAAQLSRANKQKHTRILEEETSSLQTRYDEAVLTVQKLKQQHNFLICLLQRLSAFEDSTKNDPSAVICDSQLAYTIKTSTVTPDIVKELSSYGFKSSLLNGVRLPRGGILGLAEPPVTESTPTSTAGDLGEGTYSTRLGRGRKRALTDIDVSSAPSSPLNMARHPPIVVSKSAVKSSCEKSTSRTTLTHETFSPTSSQFPNLPPLFSAIEVISPPLTVPLPPSHQLISISPPQHQQPTPPARSIPAPSVRSFPALNYFTSPPISSKHQQNNITTLTQNVFIPNSLIHTSFHAPQPTTYNQKHIHASLPLSLLPPKLKPAASIPNTLQPSLSDVNNPVLQLQHHHQMIKTSVMRPNTAHIPLLTQFHHQLEVLHNNEHR